MTTLTRRSAIAGLAAAAITLQPGHPTGASDPVDAPAGLLPYGPEHPLAQGEVVPIPDPDAPHTVLMEVEEISSRVMPPGSRPIMGKTRGAQDLLRDRLEAEADRYVAPEWIGYQRALWRLEDQLQAAGIADEAILRALDALDNAAVTLSGNAALAMLDAGLYAGRMIARDGRLSLMSLPGKRTCPACHGAAHACPTCGDTGLVDPGPELVLIYLPDEMMETEPERPVA
ncbi:MAG: hypothetical protein QM692_08085 [Thermomicrobiales bacterium]